MLKAPIREAFLTIDRDIAAHLQEISDRAFTGVEADPPPEEVLPIDQRTDPVLVEFGIDPGSLHDERTTSHPTAAPTLSDPVFDHTVGAEKSAAHSTAAPSPGAKDRGERHRK
jgi:hypothetical protein